MNKKTNFFTQKTQDAIERYLREPDEKNKSIIFTKEIYPIFELMLYKLAHKYKVYPIDDKIDSIVVEGITHLYVNSMHKYDKNKGAAFSFFTRSTINFLIHKLKTFKEEQTKTKSLDLIDTDQLKTNESEINRSEEYKEYALKFCDKYELVIPKLYKPTNVKIAYAIMELIKTAENISFLHKKELLFLIREITDCETNNITPVIKTFKKHFLMLYPVYEEEFIVDISLLAEEFIYDKN